MIVNVIVHLTTTTPYLVPGVEAVRVLVRGNIILQSRVVRSHLQHGLHRDPPLPRHEEADLQPAPSHAGCLRYVVGILQLRQYIALPLH